MTSNSPKILHDKDVATIILAGGQGERLFPLTSIRCKPAVTFGGKFRIIDIPISNSLNAKMKNIYVISQFLANTLNNYLSETYTQETLGQSHIELLSPEETPVHKLWYKGTADAVRKNLQHLLSTEAKYFFILSGDQLYWMDLGDMLSYAIEHDADLTIATIVSEEKEAKRMGVMKIDHTGKIIDFYEKPKSEHTLKKFRIDETIAKHHEKLQDGQFLGSMGIYLFKREALERLLKEDSREDFGKHLIPTSLQHGKTYAYIFNGYWEDIGTIGSFYNANIKLAKGELCLDLYDHKHTIFASSHNLPSAKIINTRLENTIVADGSVIEADSIRNSMIGSMSYVGKNTKVIDSIVLGNNHNTDFSLKPSKIGQNCHIEKAIIDEGCQIGNHVTLVNTKNLQKYDSDNILIRDGIIIVKAGSVIQDGFTLFAA